MSLISYNTQTIKLKPGEEFSLPPNAEIIFVSDSNSLVTDCATFPQTGATQCYNFLWATDISDSGGTDAWAESDTHYLGLQFNNQYYEFEAPVNGGDIGALVIQINKVLNGFMVNPAVDNGATDIGSRRQRNISMNISSTVGDTLYMIIDVSSYNPVYLKAALCA